MKKINTKIIFKVANKSIIFTCSQETAKACFALTNCTAASKLKNTFKILLILWEDIGDRKKVHVVQWEELLS